MPVTKSPKIVLITGCSSGFGLLIAARLAAAGHTVIATMRYLDKQSELLSEVNKRNASLEILQLDVTSKNSVKRAVSQIAEKYGYVDILVNNAGFGMGGAFEDLMEEEIREQMETNFFGVQTVTREVLPLMRPRKGGKIINISSISGFMGTPLLGAYNASKFALEGFSESLFYEVKPFGIDVVLIEPGTYRTKIFHENSRRASNFYNQNSPYFEMSHYFQTRVMERANACTKDPEDIAILVEKIINSRNPKFRNIPDFESKTVYLLRKFLPFTTFAWIVNNVAFKGFKKSWKE